MGKAIKYSRAVIIGGCLQYILTDLKEHLSDADYIICADKGLEYANENNIEPNLILGDFDSTKLPQHASCEVLKLPCKKDDTDLQFAARVALNRGYRDFLLTGVTGGRLDHTLASISTLNFLQKNGAKAVILDRGASLWFTENSLTLNKPKTESYFSVFPYGGKAEGVTITGAEYPLTRATLTSDFPIGVSNEFKADKITISVEKGCCLVMIVKKYVL